MHSRPKAVLAGIPDWLPLVFGDASLKRLEASVDLGANPFSNALTEAGEGVPGPETAFIFGTWNMPVLTDSLLNQMPGLQAVFYAAGSVRHFVTPSLWERNIRVFSAATANALPVAEFTFAQILLSLKKVPEIRVRSREDWMRSGKVKRSMYGNFAVRVGLVSYGLIARRVREFLRFCSHEVVVYDPFLSEEEARREGVTLVGIEELFATSEVVSLHTPLLPATRGWIGGDHLRSMKEGATFINTSRGAIVRQGELFEALQERTDLRAILDVLEAEPPAADEPLFALPNVTIYPHLAGSNGNEYQRLSWTMAEAVEDYLNGKPNTCEITQAEMDRIA